jgi:hypothetical protein
VKRYNIDYSTSRIRINGVAQTSNVPVLKSLSEGALVSASIVTERKPFVAYVSSYF